MTRHKSRSFRRRVRDMKSIDEKYTSIDFVTKNCIKDGTYGIIKKHNNMIKKTIDRYDETSIIETCFLKTYKHENIISLIEYKQTDDKIELYLEFGGITLNKYFEEFKYNEIEFLYILRQLICVLRWMEINMIVHADLSSNNIVINVKTKKIKIIDFGSLYLNNCLGNKLIYESKILPHGSCTEGFDPPENTTIGITEKFDIYSVGKICKFYKSDYYVHNPLNKILYKMLNDHSNRISIKELMIELKIKDTEKVIEIEEYNGDYDTFYKTEINYKMLSILVKWIYDVCDKYRVLLIFSLSVHLIDKYLYMKKMRNEIVLRKNLQLVGITCFKISCSFIKYEFMFSDMKYICADAYTEVECIYMVEEILNVLDYKVFIRTFDQNIKNVNYNILKEILINNRNMKQEQLEMIYKYEI